MGFLNFLAFGGLMFWAFAALFTIFLVLLIETADGEIQFGQPLLVLGVFGALCYFGNKQTIVDYFHNLDVVALLCQVGIYLVAGVVWSFFRWYRFVSKKYQKFLVEAKRLNREDDLQWRKDNRKKHLPTVGDNGDRLTSWVVFWPVSILRFLMGDLIVVITKKLVASCERVYVKIAEFGFKD